MPGRSAAISRRSAPARSTAWPWKDPIDDHFMGGIVNKYFGQDTEPDLLGRLDEPGQRMTGRRAMSRLKIPLTVAELR